MREVFKGYIIFMKDRQTNVAFSKLANLRATTDLDRVQLIV